MTQSKLLILTNRLGYLSSLLKLNILIEDLIRVDDTRLSFIIDHCDTVEIALNFAEIKEILGLNRIAPLSLGLSVNRNYSPVVFKLNASLTSTENKLDAKMKNQQSSENDEANTLKQFSQT